MSATLRYDIGQAGAAAICAADLFEDGPGILLVFGEKDAWRWGGVGKPHHMVVTFAIKLPGQILWAWRLLDLLYGLRSNGAGYGSLARSSCDVLFRKVGVSIGIKPMSVNVTGEVVFIDALKEAPGDLGNWSAYADWLQERAEPELQQRGWIMAGWLRKKPMKVKYGVPLVPVLNKWGEIEMKQSAY